MPDRSSPTSQRFESAQPIGIVSGTGPAGVALARRLAANAQHVVIGSRDAKRSEVIATSINSELSIEGPNPVTGGSNLDAAACEIVILATNAEYITEVARELAPALNAKIVVSMAARIRPGDDRGFQPDPPAAGSIAAEVAHIVPEALVVAALQHAPAKGLGNIDIPFEADVLVCGDDAEAVQTVIDRLGPISTGTFYDAGELANATAIEAMTSVLISLNVRYRNRFSVRLLPAIAKQP